MSNIIPLSEGKMPARFKNRDVSALMAEFKTGAGTGASFPIISIKGKIFTIVEDKVKTVMPNPKDPESAASYIEAVVIRTNPGKAKVFYKKGFKEGEDMGRPDCHSNDGVTPDADVAAPACKSCAACPNNAWGSRVNESGQKGRLCGDSKKLAIAAADNLDKQYLIRVPAASLKGWDEFVNALTKRGIPANEVVTKISFDQETATPKLVFKPVGFLSDSAAVTVGELYNSDEVKLIVGLTAMPKAEDGDDEPFETEAAPEPKPEPEKAEPKKAEPKKAEPKKAEPKPEPKVEVVDSGDLDLDGLSFDD